MPVVLCLQGVSARGMQISQPTGSSLFAPCPQCSLPYFLEPPCFRKAGVSQPVCGQFFLALKKKSLWLDGLSKICLPFVVLKLPGRGREREEKKRKMGEGQRNQPKWWGISNCPCPHGGLGTLEYDFPQCSKGKDRGGD
jgi:hypothetical protein